VRYLVDTNVISELRRPTPNPGVASWLLTVPDDRVHLSVVTVGEIRKGIERLRPLEPSSAASLELWANATVTAFGKNVEHVDADIADRWGQLLASRDQYPIESLLAATALVRGWTLVTRNVRQVEQTGCLLLNPFA